MVTLEIGQLVQQTDTGRVWRLIDRVSSVNYGLRWQMILVEVPPGDRRPTGDVSRVSELWLHENCIDYHPPKVDPPCGNGVQIARVVSDDGFTTQLSCLTAEAAIEWLRENLNAGDRGEWFGWDADEGTQPDMICTLHDGELIWAET